MTRGPNEQEWDEPADDGWNSDDEEAWQGEEADDECTIACPYCRAEIHEESLRCPICENYVSTEDAPRRSRPLWLVLGIILCLILVLLWILP